MITHKCVKCGYKWNPKNEDVIPVSCPRCKSYSWRESLANVKQDVH